MVDKTERMKKAMDDFLKSKKETEDYMELFVTVSRVTSQGSGLVWSDIEKIVNDSLNN